METPDQLLQRLGVMGEERVRALMAKKYFEPRQVPLVQGWLLQIDQARGNGKQAAAQDPEELIRKARAMAREAREAASAARQRADEAQAMAKAAQRFSLIAVTVGSIGLLVSTLLLFAVAIR